MPEDENNMTPEYLPFDDLPPVKPQVIDGEAMEHMRRQTAALESLHERTARELGVASPEDQMRSYRDAERKMVPIQIAVGAEPKFFASIDHEAQELWRARAMLATAAANKRTAPGIEKMFPNPEAMELNKEQFSALLEEDGVLEAMSLYAVIATQSKSGRNSGERISLNEVFDTPGRFTSGRNDFGLEGVADVTTFERMRQTTAEWLVDNIGLTDEEARDAEQIAWNIIYLSSVIEDYDSRANFADSKRIPPSVAQIKSMSTWMLMHPEERLEAKASSGESWGRLGPWSVNKYKKDPEYFKKNPPLPMRLFKNAFEELEDGDENKFLQLLVKNGRKLMIDPTAVVDEPCIDERMKEGPFAGYYLNGISPAIFIFGIYNQGLEKGKGISDIANAVKNLKLERKQRELILLVANELGKGIEPKSNEPSVSGGWLTRRGILDNAKHRSPDIFD